MGTPYDNILMGCENDLSKIIFTLSYRFASYLCVYAEPMTLLPIVVNGSKLEDLVDIAIPEKDKFQFFMKRENDLPMIRQAMEDEHPEFLVEIKQDYFYENQMDAEDTLLFTMPPVNKDRRDLLLQGVDLLYNDALGRFEIQKGQCVATLTKSLATQPDMLDDAKNDLDDLYEVKKKALDDVKQKKIYEIEEAYERYEQKKADEESNRDHSNNGMTQEDEKAKNSMDFASWKEA